VHQLTDMRSEAFHTVSSFVIICGTDLLCNGQRCTCSYLVFIGPSASVLAIVSSSSHTPYMYVGMRINTQLLFRPMFYKKVK